jgi:GntR family histidine utilization transcriptional repressor
MDTQPQLAGTVSPSSPLPLYQQVKKVIQEQINSNTWNPDSKIPSENELVNTLGVSRMTVNRALRELTLEGQLVRLQGVGTFVAHRKPQSALLEIKSISREIENRGGVHGSEVHALEELSATAALSATLGVPAGTAVYHSVLVHRESGVPIQYAERFVNPTVAPEYLKQDFTSITPSEYLLSVAPITEVEHIIESAMPVANVRRLLEMQNSEPCLILYRKTWSRDTVATSSTLIYPGSRYRIGGRFKPPSGAHRVTA